MANIQYVEKVKYSGKALKSQRSAGLKQMSYDYHTIFTSGQNRQMTGRHFGVSVRVG